jgi:hypothetical protein
MMMKMPTDRARKLIKLLGRLTKQEHLYSDEQIIEMKKQLRIVKEELLELEAKTSKGFGKK